MWTSEQNGGILGRHRNRECVVCLDIALIVIGASVCFSVGPQLLIRWRFGVDLLVQGQEVAGFKFAVVGVAYSVLLALVVIVVWNDFERTQRAVYAEAERFYNLHRTSYTYPEETGKAIRQALVGYATEVRDKDWPLMERGFRGSQSAAEAFTKLSLVVGQTKPENIRQLPSVIHAFNLMEQIADFRLEMLSFGLLFIPDRLQRSHVVHLRIAALKSCTRRWRYNRSQTMRCANT